MTTTNDMIDIFDDDDWEMISISIRRNITASKMEAQHYRPGSVGRSTLESAASRMKTLADLIDARMDNRKPLGELHFKLTSSGERRPRMWVAYFNGKEVASITLDKNKDVSKPYKVMIGIGAYIRFYKTLAGAENYVTDYMKPLMR